MNNIEEDIKRCRELIKINHSNWIGLSNQKAIEHILTDYEKQKQANEEHQKINGKLREQVKVLETKNNYLESLSNYQHICLIDSIPKRKIKDKIEELKEDKESKYYDSFLEEKDIEKTINILQELLQESEDQ